MSQAILSLIIVGGVLTLIYRRAPLWLFTLAIAAALGSAALLGSGLWVGSLSIILAILIPFNISGLRRKLFTQGIFKIFKRVLPEMSSTEREAMQAGTVWWEGELFSGRPNWKKFSDYPVPQLTAEEQAFLDGPCEELCQMIDTWKIDHEYADLPADIRAFIAKNKFLGMIIPKRYGGLEFSAYANTAVLTKIFAVNSVVSNFISVPNSLGPAELLIKYGTDEQKNYYLPRLAVAEEVPCFALTAPRAGSDAGSIPDTGVVCKGIYQGKEIIGMRLNFDKRYITLAPIASLVGLAFKLSDPDHLLGDKEEYGITCALIPRDTQGLDIGRRHMPIGSPFHNGPVRGKDIFVPLEFIIGGIKMAGHGWRMLVECLSVGRCITLPSGSNSAIKNALAATSVYARIRKQFNTPIGYFEGIQAPLARIAVSTYIIDAARTVTAGSVDMGAKPSVPSAILKYHTTEMSRQAAIDAMDIHGGKGAIKGPNNYLAVGYESVPVAITVEGANIMTRNLIIFGQGATRCHPYVLREMEASTNKNASEGLKEFDDAFFSHIGFTLSNLTASLALALSSGRLSTTPAGKTRRYYQLLNRYSASFALVADAAMLTLGGELKRKEFLSSRLGDMLSMMYLTSMVLKHYENQGRQEDDLPLVQAACCQLLGNYQTQMHELLQNLPNRFVASLLRLLVFPLGRNLNKPADKLTQHIAQQLLQPTSLRDRLIQGIYLTPGRNNIIGRMNQMLTAAEAIKPLEAKLMKAVKKGEVNAPQGLPQINQAEKKKILSKEEAKQLRDYDERVMQFINVDDFAFDEIGRQPLSKQLAAPKKASISKNADMAAISK